MFAVEGERAVVVPRPHPELVTRRVLVMEHLRGYAWGEAAAMRSAGIDTAAVLRCTLIAFLEGTLLYGVFHGDLHSGNLLVQDDGTVALLDFGITGRLDERKRLAFLRLEMGATTNDIRIQVEALRDLGALPPDADVEAVIRDLGLDRPPVDPTTMTADEMVAELREVTKALLGYGARLPKELMLFVKNILFLNGAMATMAPDVDILEEVMTIATYFTEHHGAQIARDVGAEAITTPIDLDGYRAALGFADDAGTITFRDLQERRELIRRRLQQGARESRRTSFLAALRRIVRPGRGLTISAARRSPAGATTRRPRRLRDPRPPSTRRTRAEPTATPSATWHASAACSGVETPMPTQTGRSVTDRARAATSTAVAAKPVLLTGHAHAPHRVDEAPRPLADRRRPGPAGSTAPRAAPSRSLPGRRPTAHSPTSSSGRSGMITPVDPCFGHLSRDSLRGPPGRSGCSRSSPRAGRRRRPGQVGEDPLGRRPPLERTEGRLLDGRSVDHRIRERDPHLDRIGAGAGKRLEGHQPLVVDPAGEVGQEELVPGVTARAERRLESARERGDLVCRQVAHAGPRSRARTWATSLSPRPDRLTSTAAPAVISERCTAATTQASACGGLERGQDPLGPGQEAEGLEDLLVVRGAVDGARPISARWACSGPMPG